MCSTCSSRKSFLSVSDLFFFNSDWPIRAANSKSRSFCEALRIESQFQFIFFLITKGSEGGYNCLEKEGTSNNKKTFSFCEGLFVRDFLMIFLFYSCISYNSIIWKRLTLSQSILHLQIKGNKLCRSRSQLHHNECSAPCSAPIFVYTNH